MPYELSPFSIADKSVKIVRDSSSQLFSYLFCIHTRLNEVIRIVFEHLARFGLLDLVC